MINAVYAGSFDPVTYGHLDIIKRASIIFDRLYVGVLDNISKSPLFSVDERVRMLEETTDNLKNVEITSFHGLLVDFARKCEAGIIVRGLRAVTDFEYELQLSQNNRVLAPDIDTIFLNTSLNCAYISSSIVKEIAMYGGDVSKYVPSNVWSMLKTKMN